MADNAAEPSMTDTDWPTAMANIRENQRARLAGEVVFALSSGFALTIQGAPLNSGVNQLQQLLVQDSTSMAAGVGGALALGGKNTTGGAYGVFGMVQGYKKNGTTADTAGGLKFFTVANGQNPAEAMRLDDALNLSMLTNNVQIILGNATAKAVYQEGGGVGDLHMGSNAAFASSVWNRQDTSKPSWNAFLSNSADLFGVRHTVSGSGTITWVNFLQIDGKGNVVIGDAALSTSATDGFPYFPSCAGAPTGAPTSFTGRIPAIADSTNFKLYMRFGASWKSVTFT